MESLENKNAQNLIKLNPWLLDNNCEELRSLIEEAGELEFFNPAGIAPSYSNHIADGNECSIACLKTFLGGCSMNMHAKPELFSIEVARLESQAAALADDLVALSDPNDTMSVIVNNSIRIVYVGRGSESIALSLSDKFSDETRIAYQADVVARLSKIKKYILEELAA